MTVTYSLDVATTRMGSFAKLLLKWRGGIYKLVYKELILFTFAYYLLALSYRFALKTPLQKRTFEAVSIYCRDFTDFVPITFIMGFYVSMIMTRWWQIYTNLPWPDRTCITISSFVQGTDERGRMIRRSLARYLNGMAVLVLQAISTTIKKRFPSVQHMVDAGVFTEDERVFLEQTPSPHGFWFQPSVWFANLAMQARKEGRIHDDYHLKTIIDEMLDYRSCCGNLLSFDWISVPLVYTQTVTLVVYSFFCACLMSRQYLERDPLHAAVEMPVDYASCNCTPADALAVPSADGVGVPSNIVDKYIPLFTILQFFFYMGWLKVAEELINPLGEDDDDFELNYLVDRNVQIAYLIVDDMHRRYPRLQKDLYWDEPEPDVPYTEAAAEHKLDPFLGSAMVLNIDEREANWAPNDLIDLPEEGTETPTPREGLPNGESKGILVLPDLEAAKDGAPKAHRRRNRLSSVSNHRNPATRVSRAASGSTVQSPTGSPPRSNSVLHRILLERTRMLHNMYGSRSTIASKRSSTKASYRVGRTHHGSVSARHSRYGSRASISSSMTGSQLSIVSDADEPNRAAAAHGSTLNAELDLRLYASGDIHAPPNFARRQQSLSSPKPFLSQTAPSLAIPSLDAHAATGAGAAGDSGSTSPKIVIAASGINSVDSAHVPATVNSITESQSSEPLLPTTLEPIPEVVVVSASPKHGHAPSTTQSSASTSPTPSTCTLTKPLLPLSESSGESESEKKKEEEGESLVETT